METFHSILKTVEDITTFCEKYNSWVQIYRKPKNEREEEADRLAKWLDRFSYLSNRHECTLDYIKNEDGVPISYVLDILYLKYHVVNHRFNIYVINMFKRIINYIMTYRKWPEKVDNPKSEEEVEGNHYVDWLNEAGYTPGKKIFDELVDENGVHYYEILNDLASKYYTFYINKLKILAHLEKLKVYCSSYRRWPRKVDNPKDQEEIDANSLYNWLEESGYNSDTFKYQDYADQYDVPVKTVIDNYYHIYKKKEILGEEDILQNGGSKIDFLAGYIILLASVIYSDYEKFIYYTECIKKLVDELNIDLSIMTITSYLILSVDEQMDLYYKKYLEYQGSNIDLANLYLKLFQYTLNMNKKEKREEKRRK